MCVARVRPECRARGGGGGRALLLLCLSGSIFLFLCPCGSIFVLLAVPLAVSLCVFVHLRTVKQAIQVYAFALTASDSSGPRAKIESLSHAFVSVHDQPSAHIAREINRQQLHVLLELNGHTKGNRFDVLALKPAAVQVLFHGYAGTSGADFMSHIVSDAIVLPPELATTGFAEHVLYLPAPLSFFLVEHYQARMG